MVLKISRATRLTVVVVISSAFFVAEISGWLPSIPLQIAPLQAWLMRPYGSWFLHTFPCFGGRCFSLCMCGSLLQSGHL